jgi:hypothetical protein
MHIASALRRKLDEIAATIAAYEARIDAARMDLAVLEHAARLFDPEAERDETVIPLAVSQVALPPARARRANNQNASLSESVDFWGAPVRGECHAPRRTGAARDTGGIFLFELAVTP